MKTIISILTILICNDLVYSQTIQLPTSEIISRFKISSKFDDLGNGKKTRKLEKRLSGWKYEMIQDDTLRMKQDSNSYQYFNNLGSEKMFNLGRSYISYFEPNFSTAPYILFGQDFEDPNYSQFKSYHSEYGYTSVFPILKQTALINRTYDDRSNIIMADYFQYDSSTSNFKQWTKIVLEYDSFNSRKLYAQLFYDSTTLSFSDTVYKILWFNKSYLRDTLCLEYGKIDSQLIEISRYDRKFNQQNDLIDLIFSYNYLSSGTNYQYIRRDSIVYFSDSIKGYQNSINGTALPPGLYNTWQVLLKNNQIDTIFTLTDYGTSNWVKNYATAYINNTSNYALKTTSYSITPMGTFIFEAENIFERGSDNKVKRWKWYTNSGVNNDCYYNYLSTGELNSITDTADNNNFSRLKQKTNFYYEDFENTLLLHNFNHNQQNSLTVFPNPTKGKLKIENIIGDELIITNSTGQLIKKISFIKNKIEIDISILPMGCYYILTNSQTAKILVQ
jgi:Secretion system C-terminal sorting domain